MKQFITCVVGLLILAASPACGQRQSASILKYDKACDALFEEKDNEKALKIVNEQLGMSRTTMSFSGRSPRTVMATPSQPATTTPSLTAKR